MSDDYIKVEYEIFENENTEKIKTCNMKFKGFLPWYVSQQHINDWNFKEEIKKYCRADVELLSKAVLTFRKDFIDNLDTDPWKYTTLASLCLSIYKNTHMPEKTIVGNSTPKKDSILCREWLNSLNNENIVREHTVFIKQTIYFR